MTAKVIAKREQTISKARASAISKGNASRDWVDLRAKDTAYGVKLSAGVVGGFLRGFFRK